MTMTPVAALMMLAQGVAVDLRGTQMHTQRTKVHEAGEGDDPEVRGEDYVTTIELREEPGLDPW